MSYLEMRILKADTGEARWLARRGHMSAISRTSELRFTGVIYDVTAGKRSEEKLRELNETLETRVQERTRERDSVWSLSKDLFGVFGLSGEIRAVNPAWAELLGYAEDEVLGIAGRVAGASRGHAGLAESDCAPPIGAPSRDFDVRVRDKEGAYRWINWTITPGRRGSVRRRCAT